MNLDQALRDLDNALQVADGRRGRDTHLRAARRVLIDHGMAALGLDSPAQPTIESVLKLAANAPAQDARRTFAVLVVHALAIRGLVPNTAAADVCALVESTLRDVLIRCGYPFSGSIHEKHAVLERLHASINELLQPLEPTFPGWLQGMHAG